MFRPGSLLTPRRCLVLILELTRTPGSPLAAEFIGDQSWRGWTREASQIADAVDMINQSIYAMLKVKGVKRLKQPKAVAWRPKRPRTTRTLKEIAKAISAGTFIAPASEETRG